MGALRKLCTRPGALGGVPRGQAPVLLLLRVRRRRGHIGGVRGNRGKQNCVRAGAEDSRSHCAPAPAPSWRALYRVTRGLRETRAKGMPVPPWTRECKCEHVYVMLRRRRGQRGQVCARKGTVLLAAGVGILFPAALHRTCLGSSCLGSRETRSSAPPAVKGPAQWGERLSLPPTQGGKLEATRRRPTLARVRRERP